MKKIIIANWKMNHAFDEADIWIDGFFKNFAAQYERLKKLDIVLCPPALLLDYIDSELMHDALENLEETMKSEQKKIEDFSAEELNQIILRERPIRLGAQDCHHEIGGSFTGDISATMLAKVGCEYVIIGHSERRDMHFETNEIIAKKIEMALSQKLIPIICVGENKEVREQGKHLEFVYRQIMKSISPQANFQKLVIAYEPIWSIGTGLTPTTEQISEMARLIKKIFDEKLQDRAKQYFTLYGGSVTSQNSAEILAINGINGLLVGKASLDVEEFVKICLS
jgi:triosephosphate isomerase